MTQTLWIYSRRHRWWTNGVYKVTEEIISSYSLDKIQAIIYHDTGIAICKDTFKPYELPRPDWKPKSIEEVISILNGTA